jgi:hypothetical protein
MSVALLRETRISCQVSQDIADTALMISITRYSPQRRQPHIVVGDEVTVFDVSTYVVIGVTECFVTCTVLDVDWNVVAGVVVEFGVVVVGSEVVLQLQLSSLKFD